MSTTNKATRKAKFSREEVEALISGYEMNSLMLTAKLGPSVTKQRKDHCWRQISNNVNAVGAGTIRTVNEVKIKWKDIKKSSKAKVVTYRKEVAKSGCGSLPDKLDPLVERTAAIIGEVSISGIPGGLEIGGQSDEDDLDVPNLPNLIQQATLATAAVLQSVAGTHQHDLTQYGSSPDTSLPGHADLPLLVELITASDMQTQTAVTGDDKMSALLAQGERQIAANERQATASERQTTALEALVVILKSIDESLKKR